MDAKNGLRGCLNTKTPHREKQGYSWADTLVPDCERTKKQYAPRFRNPGVLAWWYILCQTHNVTDRRRRQQRVMANQVGKLTLNGESSKQSIFWDLMQLLQNVMATVAENFA